MIHLLYSIEPSTQFLSVVSIALTQKFPDSIIFFPLENDFAFEECRVLIQASNDDDLIVFLGHGASHQLYGPVSQTGDKQVFVDINHYSIFQNKQLFCLSCNSNELIKKLGITCGFGFGDLPTDWNHILAVRQLQDINAYINVTDEVISSFCTAICDLVIGSLSDYITRGLSIQSLFDFFMLRLNKLISSVLMERPKSTFQMALSRLLFDLKCEVFFYKNSLLPN